MGKCLQIYTAGSKCKASCPADWDFYVGDAKICLSKGILRMRWLYGHLGDPEMYNATKISLNKAFGNAIERPAIRSTLNARRVRPAPIFV